MSTRTLLKTSVMTLSLAGGICVAPIAQPLIEAHAAEVKTYSYTLEAYDNGKPVASHAYSVTAGSDFEAALGADRTLALWGNELTGRGIKWTKLRIVLNSKS